LDVTGAQLTVADISPGATDRFVGAVNVATQPSPLMPTTFVLAEAEQGPTIPALFVSATVHVMVWLITFSKPVTTIGLDGPVTRATAPETDDEQVAVYCAPGSPSPVKPTLTDPMVTKVTDTFVGAFGVAADADVADIVSAPPANRITLAENPNIFLKLRFMVLLEAAAMCPQRDYDVRVATYERYGDTTLTTRCNSKVVQKPTDRTQTHPNQLLMGAGRCGRATTEGSLTRRRRSVCARDRNPRVSSGARLRPRRPMLHACDATTVS
jgi:hypothetical protein